MSAQVKVRRNKVIDTEWDGISISITYNAWIDCQLPTLEEGHGSHRIDNSTLEIQLLSVDIKLGEEETNILYALTEKQKSYLISQLD